MSFALLSTVSMLIVLGIMVLVHEFGHFLVAKWCGVRVEAFSIGMGKRLFGFRRGDTDYRISLLPIGGYVKMSGEVIGDLPTGDENNDPGDYNNHPRWQRVLIACAGPAANFILAFFLLTIVYMAHNEVSNFMTGPAVVDYVQPHTTAALAGMERGDKIVSFDGVKDPDWSQVYIHTILNLNHNVSVSVVRHDGANVGQIQNLQMLLPNISSPDDFTLQDLGLAVQEQNDPLRVSTVESPNYPGYKAGLREGDQIAAVDGIPFRSISSIILYLQEQAGKPLTVTVLRNGQMQTLHMEPVLKPSQNGQPAYQIGFGTDAAPYHVEHLGLWPAMQQSVHENIKGSTLIVEVLHRMVTLRMSVRTLSGPVGIAQATGKIVSMPGWSPLFGEMATISLNLGIFNLLPIPILDGGVILLLLIESLMRKDMNHQIKERIYQSAFVFLILIFAFVMLNDLSKIPLLARLHSTH